MQEAKQYLQQKEVDSALTYIFYTGLFFYVLVGFGKFIVVAAAMWSIIIFLVILNAVRINTLISLCLLFLAFIPFLSMAGLDGQARRAAVSFFICAVTYTTLQIRKHWLCKPTKLTE